MSTFRKIEQMYLKIEELKDKFETILLNLTGDDLSEISVKLDYKEDEHELGGQKDFYLDTIIENYLRGERFIEVEEEAVIEKTISINGDQVEYEKTATTLYLIVDISDLEAKLELEWSSEVASQFRKINEEAKKIIKELS